MIRKLQPSILNANINKTMNWATLEMRSKEPGYLDPSLGRVRGTTTQISDHRSAQINDGLITQTVHAEIKTCVTITRNWH